MNSNPEINKFSTLIRCSTQLSVANQFRNLEQTGIATKIIQSSPSKISEPSERTINAGNYDNPKEDSNFWSLEGKGPTWLGLACAALNTITELTVGTLFPYSFKASTNPRTRLAQERIANAGRQLAAGDIHHYISGIKGRSPHEYINQFYFNGTGAGINQMHLSNIQKTIQQTKMRMKNPNEPIVIPVAFTGQVSWELNHVAVIVIKDNTVEYFDAKGILSKHRTLADGHTLEDVLKLCKETFTPNGSIAENSHTYQFDAHNCGVFVCRHLHDRLVNNSQMGKFSETTPPLSQVSAFRQEIIKVAYPC